ncbi:hypothetical protein V8G54_026471 [Vigna mungo]|uniref:Secreted peptide n=1 Tax=Vigna mungo TaxID=3915 RepID=A0AAQ3N0E0_VIGMU
MLQQFPWLLYILLSLSLQLPAQLPQPIVPLPIFFLPQFSSVSTPLTYAGLLVLLCMLYCTYPSFALTQASASSYQLLLLLHPCSVMNMRMMFYCFRERMRYRVNRGHLT